MSIYRKEPEHLPVSEERLDHLERCEAVLDALENRTAWVHVYRAHRARWYIKLNTDKVVVGPTLREAVENALGYAPAPIRQEVVVRTGFGPAFFMSVLCFLAGAFIF